MYVNLTNTLLQRQTGDMKPKCSSPPGLVVPVLSWRVSEVQGPLILTATVTKPPAALCLLTHMSGSGESFPLKQHEGAP